MEVTLTKNNFEAEVLQSKKPVLVDFWATWCGPCQMMGPIVEEIANTHPEIKVGKVNIDDEEALAIKYHVSAIPTFIVFKDGKPVNTTLGYMPKEKLEELIK